MNFTATSSPKYTASDASFVTRRAGCKSMNRYHWISKMTDQRIKLYLSLFLHLKRAEDCP